MIPSRLRFTLLVLLVLAAGTLPLGAQATRIRILVDGRPLPSDAVAIIHQGRVLVPARAIAESLGATVQWHPESRTIVITRSRAVAPPPTRGTVLWFFFVVNQTGANIQVRVAAGGQELFIRNLPAVPTQTGTVPPPGLYPTLELKIPISAQAEQLEVSELLYLKATRTFDIGGFTRTGAGFRIVITREGITLTQDYYPIR